MCCLNRAFLISGQLGENTQSSSRWINLWHDCQEGTYITLMKNAKKHFTLRTLFPFQKPIVLLHYNVPAFVFTRI